jgi:peroxiredoxin
MSRYKPLNDSVTALVKRKEYYSAEMSDLLNELRNAKESNARDSVIKKISLLKSSGNDVTPKVKLINKETDKIIQESNEWRFGYIKENQTLVSYYLLLADAKEMEYKQVKIENIKKGFDIFSEKYPEHPYTDQLKAIIDGLEKIKIGGRFIDFSLPDINGDMHTLSDVINNKFALIDLWATWCGPCIKNSRAMIPVYERYKDKGFTVCGVAGEFKNTDQLKVTLVKEKFPWLTLVEIDNKNQIWNLYGRSNSGGGTFLVDKDGLILAIDPTPQKVDEILNDKLK